MTGRELPKRFAEPTSCDDANVRIQDLLEKRRDLEFLLSMKRNIPEDRARVPQVKRTMYAVEKEVRYLKRWLVRRRREIDFLLAKDGFCINREDVLSVLAGAYHLLVALAKRHGVDEEEQIVMNIVDETLKDRGFRVSQQRGG